MKPKILFPLFVTTSLLLAGCGYSENTFEGQSLDVNKEEGMYAGPVGDSENNLNVLVWPGYAEEGNIDPVIDWVTPFEKSTGCDVSVKTFNTPQEALNLMRAGGYDIVSAPSEISFGLIE